MNKTRLTSTVCGRLLALIALVLICCSALAAQTPPRGADNDKNDTRTFASLEEEMRAKRAIQSEEKAYKDNLNRARNLASIGASLSEAFQQKKYLDHADIKKLDKAEKFAKGIRDAAGGSSEDVEMEKHPADLAAAVTQFSCLTESLKNRVEKTPKRVISAAVIDEANVLLELIRIVRAMHPKT